MDLYVLMLSLLFPSLKLIIFLTLTTMDDLAASVDFRMPHNLPNAKGAHMMWTCNHVQWARCA
jgi:hypothetical protein